jgi:hypothetical protein
MNIFEEIEMERRIWELEKKVEKMINKSIVPDGYEIELKRRKD